MAASLKRLICKRFGGTTNFLSLFLLIGIIFLLMRNYSIFPHSYISSSHQSKVPVNNNNKNYDSNEIHKYQDHPHDHESPLIDEQHLKDHRDRERPHGTKPVDDGAKQGATKAVMTTKKLLRVTAGPTHPDCVIDEKCSSDSIPYKVVSGEGMISYPTICFNGQLLMGKNSEVKVGRGVNVVVINNETLEVKTIENFDTFQEDSHFHRLIKTGVEDGDIFMLASYDEMAVNIREVTSKFMENYGSQLFKNIKYRDSFAMLGQRGIAKGKALEMLEAKGSREFAPAAKVTGCARFPLGIISPVKTGDMHVNAHDQIVVASLLKNCGLREECKSDEFAVHVYTGKNDQDEPKICVDGRYVIAKGANDAGRGLNIAVVGNGKEILKTAHFDTYAEDSTNLEIFLESLDENMIIIIVTFDEASNKLATLARNLLFEIGSGVVQNLRHRDAWYLIGRKGINGFSPLEEISYAGADNAYPQPLDKRMCVPQALKGMKIRPDPLPNVNDKRRNFCSKYDGYGDFCINENIDKPLKPAPIINKTLEEHPVYNTPILIIGGLSHNSLRMTLETVIMQPGIRPDLVYVCLDEKLDEQASLVELFGFQYVPIKSSYNYMDIYHKSLSSWFSNSLEKEKQTVIVVEEELILSPDFLYFFSQVYDTFMNDPNLVAVSSWNPNSFLQLDGSSSYIYRTNEFPGFGYLLKRSFYEKFMHENLKTCCKDRAWLNWEFTDENKNRVDVDVLIPDVSRVFHRPYDVSSTEYNYLQSLFNRKRKTNLIPFPELEDLKPHESRQQYETYLRDILKRSSPLANVQECFVANNGTAFTSWPSKRQNEYFKVIYEQKSKEDLTNLKVLAKCFHLFNHESSNPKSLYQGNILRFNAHSNNYILIGSKSPLLNNL